MDLKINKLLVIVPYRDREDHLKIFISHINKELQKQKIQHKIVIVEQYDANLFNRGLLINTGFYLFANKYDYICIHDIDIIGENFDYDYCNGVTHLSAKPKEKNYMEWYKNCLGGVVLFPKSDFISINGFSNEYWGWGCEDDDLKTRCDIMSITTYRKSCQYYTLKHTSIGEHLSQSDRIKHVPGYKENLDRLKDFLSKKNKTVLLKDGLSNINKYFTVKEIIEYKNYTLARIQTNKETQ